VGTVFLLRDEILLLLYLTKYHLFSDAGGLDVLGSYAALVYASPVIGGLLADRYLGMRKAVIFGGVLLVLGHLGMAMEGEQAHRVGDDIVRDEGALQVFLLFTCTYRCRRWLSETKYFYHRRASL